MNDVVLVQIVDGLKDLFDGLRRILFRELSLLANTVEKLSASSQFGYDVVLVLQGIVRVECPVLTQRGAGLLTRDSNQSTNLTIWGCLRR